MRDLSINPIVILLMERDGMSFEEACQAWWDAKAMVDCGDDPEEVLMYEFGLEPDYLFDLT